MSCDLVQALLKEAKDQKPVVDKLNDLSSSLLDLIPWHHREGLDKMVTEDTERYRSVCDAITKQVDQINADLLKSQQVNQILLIFHFYQFFLLFYFLLLL